jgi:hypothetical protein
VLSNLKKYINEIFPSVFGNKSRIHRLVDEIKRHHRYLNLISISGGAHYSEKKRILTCFQLLTVQSLLMFLLSIFYDLQGPGDDGTCQYVVNKGLCLQRKSVLDSSKSYCEWVANGDIVAIKPRRSP